MGRETNLPVDVMAGLPPRQHSFYNASDYAQWLVRAMAKSHEYARGSLEKAATRQARNYERNVKETWDPQLSIIHLTFVTSWERRGLDPMLWCRNCMHGTC